MLLYYSSQTKKDMRPKGSTPEYITDRDHALLKAYKRVMTERTQLHWREIVRRSVDSPCERFWVSEKQAIIVMREMLAGKTTNVRTDIKRKMYDEIHQRVVKLLTDRPDMSLSDAVFQVIHSPAPKFYLSEKSAYVIIQRTKKKCFEERKRKLRRFLQGQ